MPAEEEASGFNYYSALIEAESRVGVVRRNIIQIVRKYTDETGSITVRNSLELAGLLVAEAQALERWALAIKELEAYEEKRKLPWEFDYGFARSGAKGDKA